MALAKVRLLLVSGSILSLVLAACGGGEEQEAPQPSAPPAATTTPGATAAPVPQPTATPRPTTAPAPTATAAPVSTGELVITEESLGTFGLFPFPTNSGTVASAIGAIYDPVVAVSQLGRLEFDSGFVTSTTANGDSTVWTLKVRKNVVFQNGDPATSKDIVFAINLFTSKESFYTRSVDLRRVLTKMETPDDQTVVFTSSEPNIFFPHSWLSKLGPSIPDNLWPQKYVESVGYGEANKKPVGSGPYKFKSIVIGDRVVVEAVDQHWYWGVPRIKTISFLQMPEESTRIALLKTGASDFSRILEQNASSLKGSGIRTFEGARNHLIIHSHLIDLPLQSGEPNPLSNEDVRKALVWYAIDRAAMAAAFFPLSGKVDTDYPLNPIEVAYDPSNKTPVPPFDPSKARALLAQAGYPRGFEIDTVIWNQTQPEAFEAISVYWEQIGLKVNRIPLLLPNFQRLSFAAAKDRWKKATISWNTQSSDVIAAQREPLIGHSAGAFSASGEPEATRLGIAWASAKTVDEYVKAGRAYQRYNSEHLTGWWTVGVSFATVYAGSSKLPKDWAPNSNGSLNFARAAASR